MLMAAGQRTEKREPEKGCQWIAAEDASRAHSPAVGSAEDCDGVGVGAAGDRAAGAADRADY